MRLSLAGCAVWVAALVLVSLVMAAVLLLPVGVGALFE